MDKRPIGYIKGKGNPLDKRPPPNKKYTHVKSRLEGQTGLTVKDVSLMSDQHVAKRKGELFSRVKPSTLAQLIELDTNQESIYQIGEGEEEKFNTMNHQVNDAESVYSFVTANTQATQVSQITQATQQLGITDDTGFLLLDLREPEDYQKFHIREAVSYPGPNISRDKLIPELFRYKNKENKMIIIYMNDERSSIQYGQLMAQKDYNNLYLLNGGIEGFMQEFPEYIEGSQIPNIPKLNPGDRKKKLVKRSNHIQDPKQKMNFKESKVGENIANTIIQNNQNTNTSVANQSDISSVRFGGAQQTQGIPNPTLNKQTLQNLGGGKQ